MTNQCPRCGTPRVGDFPFCQRCGLDFRLAGASAMPPQQQLPPQQPLHGTEPPASYPQPPASYPPASYPPAQGYPPTPQPEPAPAVCLRCYAPLNPGSPLCTNCGFDNRIAWSMPAPVAAKRSMLPAALALVGVALIVAALVLVAVAQSRSGATPTLTPLITPAASIEATPTPQPTAALATEPPAVPSAPASAAVISAAGTTEPSPAVAWTGFSAPDGAWSASFPGSAPLKSTTPLGTGAYGGDATVYMSLDGFAEYVVCYMDFSTDLGGGLDQAAVLRIMETSMNASFDGTETSSTASSVGTHPARDVTLAVTSPAEMLTHRMWFVGQRFYMIFTVSAPGLSVYPQHFFDGFKLT